jgi:hypothetical protein
MTPRLFPFLVFFLSFTLALSSGERGLLQVLREERAEQLLLGLPCEVHDVRDVVGDEVRHALDAQDLCV